MPPTVNAKTVRAVLGVAKGAGLDPGKLAEAHGLGGALTDIDARFPHASWIALWEELSARTGRPSLGIDAAENLPWGHWDVMDYLLGSAEDLGAGLRRFERYFPIISTGVRHVLEPNGDTVHIARRYAPGCETRLLAPAEFAFATTVARLRTTLGFPWCPREITFAAPPPSSDAAHRRFFGCPVRFATRTSAIVIDAAELSLPMKHRDAQLFRILEQHAEHLVGALRPDADFVSRLRVCIVRTLPDGQVSVARAARELGVSVRTLQRRLGESGITFDEVYDRVRSDLARRYLDDPSLSIQETAHLLAFSDLRGFYRAFKRWEGRTPAEYRLRPKPGVRGRGTPSP
ncbi:MAG: AraC family transcriptional regulator [Polyangiaceae bacterium]